MTDRLEGFTVILAERLREDDAEAIAAAIRQLRGVVEVRPVVTTSASYFGEMRARGDLAKRLLDFIDQELRGSTQTGNQP